MSEPLIIEYSSPGRKTGLLPEIDLPDKDRALSEYISEDYLRKESPGFLKSAK